MNCRSFKRRAIICALTTALACICVPAAHASQPAVCETADTTSTCPTDTVPDRLTRYERNTLRRVQRWNKLIPSYSKLQFAGGMGLVSVGTGWEYGKNRQWETDLLLGIIPKHSSKRAKVTLTLKQNFTPWRVPLRGRFALEPLSTGLYLNTVFGGEFWMKNPDRYPQGYYWFSTRMRIHIFVGQRIRCDIPENRRWFLSAITAFYELSTCDLYVIQAVRNSYMKAGDVLRLSFGLKCSF